MTEIKLTIKHMKNKNNRKEGIGGLFKIIVSLICAASPLFCFAQEYVETTVMTFPNKQLKIERIEVVSPSKNSTWYMIDASCNDSLFTISSVGDPYYDKEGKKIIIGNTYTMSLYGHYLEQFEIDAGFDRFKWGSKKIIKKNHRDIVFLTDNLIGDRYVEHKEYKLNGNIQRPSEVMSGANANGRQYVDLGLPSGTLWATCNIGANTPEITESYIGAKLAMEKGVGSREKGIKNPFYKKAHEKAINQPVLYSSFITDEYKRVQYETPFVGIYVAPYKTSIIYRFVNIINNKYFQNEK